MNCGRQRRFELVALTALTALLSACSSGSTSQAIATPSLSAAPWPEANALFERDPTWIGGDGAYSIDLGAGRILWLFGDSFIATSPARKRTESRVIRNSIALQQGSNPATATAHFAWRTLNAQPASFFPESNGVWFWPGHGARLDSGQGSGQRSGLLLFLMRVRASAGGLGFTVEGSVCQFIENPDDDPLTWRSREVPFSPVSFAMIGVGGVMSDAHFFYAYSPREPGNHDVFLVRWPKAQAALGDLSKPEWWTSSGWTAQASLAREPKVVFPNGQTEFTVSPNAHGGFSEIQSSGFGATDIALRTSSAPEGPWSATTAVYTPPESSRPGALVYAGKAHPELQGADMVLTYVANHSDFATVQNDMSLYYPRFVRVTDAP